MIGVESTVVINRPVEDVFAFVSDQTNEPKWHTDVLEVHPASGDPTRPGKYLGLGDQVYGAQGVHDGGHRLRAEPPRRAHHEEGPHEADAHYRFEAADGGTRFTRRVDVQPDGMFRIMEPMMRGMVQKGNDRFVQNLKRVLERS